MKIPKREKSILYHFRFTYFNHVSLFLKRITIVIKSATLGTSGKFQENLITLRETGVNFHDSDFLIFYQLRGGPLKIVLSVEKQF